MTATNVPQLPEGAQWLYEVKLDGYRALILKNGKHVQIRSRRNNDLTATYPGIHAAALNLNAATVVLDGELVALDTRGRPSFQALQHRRSQSGHVVVFYAFDVLHLDGTDFTQKALFERRAVLPKVLKGSGLLISETLPGTAQQVIQAVAQLGLEGVIAKRKDSVYNAGLRTGAWVKLKLDKQQELVIGGYRPGPHGVDALVVGYYADGKLYGIAKVRAGFTPPLRRAVFNELKPLHTSRCPFVNLPSAKTGRWGSGITAEDVTEMQWVKPNLVAQIRFVEWTADDNLRHAAFVGLREDKDPKDVGRDP